MKKLISLLFLIVLVLPLISCSSGLEAVNTGETVTEETASKTEEVTTEEEPLPTGEIVYPKGFSVGYNRQDVSPTAFPIPTYTHFNHTGYSNHDPIQLTCTALCDGTTAVLLISFDIRGVPTGFVDYSARLIEEAVGIPKERVFINSTHTHSAPDNSHFGEGANMLQWQKMYYKKLVRAVTLALHDLTPAEAYIGTSHTEGITFVRRYRMDDGTYETNPSNISALAVAHETEADTEMRAIRFDREEGKDVVLVNYQTHYGGSYPTQVSADFVHPFREQAEEELDCLFAYHNGASGNLNFQSAIKGERKYSDIYKAVPAMVETLKDALANAEEAQLSTIQTEASYYQGRGKGGGKTEVRFYAFGMGDIAFCSAPYEMFDTNGMEIRESSPYKMTFVCAYTNGHMGYCPSALAYPHGSYEVEVSPFASGSGEEFAAEIVRLLNLCKEKG